MKGIVLWLLLAFLTGIPLQAQAAEEGMEVGGIHILKTDVTGNPLEGAVFQIFRETDTQGHTDRGLDKKLLKIGEENRLMSVMSFWQDREMTGSRVHQVRTDKNGQAAIYGLPYGTYYLMEMEAPSGYNRITDPVRLSIHRYSHLTQEDQILDDTGKVIDNTLHIINVRYALPDTGSWGRIQLGAAGIGIVFSSISLILLSRRRRGW